MKKELRSISDCVESASNSQSHARDINQIS